MPNAAILVSTLVLIMKTCTSYAHTTHAHTIFRPEDPSHVRHLESKHSLVVHVASTKQGMILGNGQLASKIFHKVEDRIPELLVVTPIGRNLQFQDIDDLLQEVTLTLPDFPFTVGPLDLVEMQVVARDIVCNNFSIDDIQISHERKSDEEVALVLVIDGLAFECDLVWEYVSALD